MLLVGASLSNPGDFALDAPRAQIAGDVVMAGALACDGGPAVRCRHRRVAGV
jgi:hypothetical protein